MLSNRRMKTLIFILILAGFLQASVVPIDLVAVILIARSYIKVDQTNLILAVVLGLFVSHLTFTPWGLQSLIYLSLVEISYLVSKSPISANAWSIIPVGIILLSFDNVATALVAHQSINIWVQLIWESLLILPVYILLRFFDERFTIRDIKLKI